MILDAVLEEIPNRIVKVLAFACEYYESRKLSRIVALTVDCKFYEIYEGNVIFAVDLQEFLPDITLRHYTSYTHDDPGPSDEDSDHKASADVALGKFFHYRSKKRTLYLLLKVYDKLIAIRRTSEGLKVVESYSQVDYFELVDPDHTYQTKVAIYQNGDDLPILSDFGEGTNRLDGEIESRNETLQALQEKVENLNIDLKIQKDATTKKFHEVSNLLTFGPNHIRSDVRDEKQSIGLYGDVWMKVHNQFLVIGIPVISKSSKRLTTLQNVRPVLLSDHRDNIEYEYNLYTLNDDSITFENFEQLFENIDKAEKNLKFDQDWVPDKETVLRPENSGVVTIKAKLTDFVDYTTTDYKIFILYDVKSEDKVYSLQYFVRNVRIPVPVLYDTKYLVSMDSRGIYKDLLTITSTMQKYDLYLKYLEEISYDTFETFLVEQVGFSRVTIPQSGYKIEIEDNESHQTPEFSHVFYHKDKLSYWNGTLLRLGSLKETSVLIKIYLRDQAQLFAFAQIIYKKFDENCVVLPTNYILAPSKLALDNLEELRDSLLKEINLSTRFFGESSKLNEMNPADLLEYNLKLFEQELETDTIYSRIV